MQRSNPNVGLRAESRRFYKLIFGPVNIGIGHKQWDGLLLTLTASQEVRTATKPALTQCRDFAGDRHAAPTYSAYLKRIRQLSENEQRPERLNATPHCGDRYATEDAFDLIRVLCLDIKNPACAGFLTIDTAC